MTPTRRVWRHTVRVGTTREVPVREETIRLGQFLKLADVAASGSDARRLLEEGGVLVNGLAEHRRGRRLSKGDVVTVGPEALRVG